MYSRSTPRSQLFKLKVASPHKKCRGIIPKEWGDFFKQGINILIFNSRNSVCFKTKEVTQALKLLLSILLSPFSLQQKSGPPINNCRSVPLISIYLDIMLCGFVRVFKPNHFLGLLLCLAFLNTGLGQTVTFSHLKAENGLVSNSVLSIAQDATGFMWFGTSAGLTRYDGTRFKIYKSDAKNSATLDNNNFMSLFCDSKGVLWAGSSFGLNRYNVRTDAFERIRLSKNQTGTIYCIYEDRKGNLWVGAAKGLYLLSGRNKDNIQSFYPSNQENGIAGNTVRAIFEDHNGYLWVGTDEGLNKIQLLNGRLHFETFRHEASKAGTISANYITTIAEDKQHNLWIGTQNDGVNLYDPINRSFTAYAHSGKSPGGIINNSIRKIISSAEGKLWVGTQEGLSIIDPVSKVISSYQHDAGNEKSLSQNSVHSLLEDANGSVWVGTYFGGVNVTYSYHTPFSTIQNKKDQASLSNNVVSSMVEDERHNLWIGTEGGGLNYYDRSSGLFTTYKNELNKPGSLSSNLVKVVYLDRDGNPWAGTHGGGLNVFDRKEKKFDRFLYKENDPATLNSEIPSLLEDAAGRFWVVRNFNLRLFKRNKTALQPLDLFTELPSMPRTISATVLYEDAAQNLWIGAAPGLYKVESSVVKTIDTAHHVNCIREDVKGNIWLGLNFGGLAKLDKETGKVIRYTRNQDFISANILGILADNKNNLWLSTNNGLVLFNPEQNYFRTYTVSDGLAGNEFNYNSYLKDSRGELFFGGFNGITRFFPDKIQTNRYVAPVVFTGLKLFNTNVDINSKDQLLKENINLAKELIFKYDQDVFTIEFALLNFIKSNKNKYAYKLEGFDNDWNEVTTASATYTNLPSGSYTFYVKGANNDGVWSEPASVKITILPPFWLTWWAYCIYTAIIAALLFLIIRFFFLKALLKKENQLHQVKLNFFTNISHEIRTHLTLIMTPVEQLMDRKEKGGFDYQQLTQVKNNANRLLKLVNELMDFRKAETQHLKLRVERHNLIPFLQDIYTSFRELAVAKNIATSFIHDTEEAPLYFDKEQLEKVFFNLLTNAFKFTPAGGRIMLHITKKENRVIVSVIDNGRGIAQQYLDKIFTNFFQVADHGVQNTGYGIGLALSKHIIELHKGTITVESKTASNEQEGQTVFVVTLLQGNKHLEEVDLLQTIDTTKKTTSSEEIEATSPIIQTTGSKDKPFTILIAEDNLELRTLIHQTFNNHYNVLLCEDGLKGWESAVNEIPDLIISDVMMPEMDGFTLCERLKKDERTSHIPVILLTAKTAQSEQISGLETGADVYLTKPFSTKVLELNVRNLLASREIMRLKFSQHINEQPQEGKSIINTVEDSFVTTVDKEFLNRVIQLVEEHMDDPDFGVEMLSRKVAMSAPILYKKIKAVTNMSVNEFVKSLRLKKAAELLAQKQMTVYEVAYAVGYNDRKYFSKEFKKQFGKTPSEYINSNEVSSSQT